MARNDDGYTVEYMQYDPLRLVTHAPNASRSQSYGYYAFGNLLAVTDRINGSTQTRNVSVSTATSRLTGATDPVTIRDLDGRPPTRFESGDGTSGVWRRARDYVYRGTTLVAMDTDEAWPRDRQFISVDHLGSTRLITEHRGFNVAIHNNLGLGETSAQQPPTRPRSCATRVTSAVGSCRGPGNL